ncbi:amidohydrolase family protein [Burkholderia guangdongensis]|uniref:amidohydrolase family protein n=1 Tax=Burkholderia guangdongensis TaxID=1792500 RepID=UPI0015C843D1|nr:amidohydrolase family protein [Burkholderia guangdongensis]
MPDHVIRNVRPLGGPAVDVVLDDGRISAMLPAGRAAPDLPVLVDGQGQLLLPALVESHVHFDKTLWTMPWRPNSAGPTRNHRISNEHTVLQNVQVPIAERAGPLIEHCIARGSLYFRSHVDCQTVWGLRHVEAMLAVRERYRHVIDLQLVAFPQGGLLISPGTLDLMKAALDLGVDVVGGIDPAGIDRDPIRHLDTVFQLAAHYRRGIDIHLHDLGELGRWEIERLCDMTQAFGLQGQVVISHAYSLGAFPPADLHGLADRLAALDVAIMTCAPPNVTVPPVAMLRSRGVTVCSGSDGIRDAWSPLGDGDMLERAMLIALRFGWSKDEELAMAFDMVSRGGAKALDIASYGLDAGCPANLLLLPAENIGEAIVNRSLQRTVVSRGRIVARDGVFVGA